MCVCLVIVKSNYILGVGYKKLISFANISLKQKLTVIRSLFTVINLNIKTENLLTKVLYIVLNVLLNIV